MEAETLLQILDILQSIDSKYDISTGADEQQIEILNQVAEIKENVNHINNAFVQLQATCFTLLLVISLSFIYNYIRNCLKKGRS